MTAGLAGNGKKRTFAARISHNGSVWFRQQVEGVGKHVERGRCRLVNPGIS